MELRYACVLSDILSKYSYILYLVLILSNKINASDCIVETAITNSAYNLPELIPYEVTADNLIENEKPSPLVQFIRKQQKRNRKITAAILAFPFPFGIVGLHRIYLGCAPYVPVVYIATVGGGFGILPFIDFCMIILEKDIDRFTNNQNVFMWVK